MIVVYHSSAILSLGKATEEKEVRERKWVFASDSDVLLNICRLEISGSQLCACESPGGLLNHADAQAPFPGISMVWAGNLVWFGDLPLVFFRVSPGASNVQTRMRTIVSGERGDVLALCKLLNFFPLRKSHVLLSHFLRYDMDRDTCHVYLTG